MAEHPVIFSGDSVRGIIAGIKTQTRRIPSCTNCLVDGKRWSAKRFAELDFSRARLDDGPSPAGNVGPYLHVPYADGTTHRVYPLWQPGDVLRAKETWFSPAYETAGEIPSGPGCVYYKADGDTVCWDGPWRSPRFMPRWASRLFLSVIDTRWQRLRDISEADAKAEGARPYVLGHGFISSTDEAGLWHSASYRRGFAELWDPLNAKRGHSWEANEWILPTRFIRKEG